MHTTLIYLSQNTSDKIISQVKSGRFLGVNSTNFYVNVLSYVLTFFVSSEFHCSSKKTLTAFQRQVPLIASSKPLTVFHYG